MSNYFTEARVIIIMILFAVPGGTELVIIMGIAVLLFGASRIPKLARSSGQAMGEFKKGREEVEQELEEIKDKGDEDEKENE